MQIPFGLIGEKLGHSYSPEIHEMLRSHPYGLYEMPRGNVHGFIRRGDFTGMNVTVPYKIEAFDSADTCSPAAIACGCVNTLIKKNGVVIGYNTDPFGLESLLRHYNTDPAGKTVLILGTGGAAQTAMKVCRDLGAQTCLFVSRSLERIGHAVSYREAAEKYASARLIINATPVGMYPDIYASPIDLSPFSELSAVVDLIYNPARTELILNARQRGITAVNGLYMLVAQAVKSSELFTDSVYPGGTVDRIYKKIKGDKTNIVLTGMPSSGKTTVGKLLADRLGRPFYDTDALIEKKAGMSVREIFVSRGEKHFRETEKAVIRGLASVSGAVIATGGGAVLDTENVGQLQRNGLIYFLDRPLSLLTSSADRPLASDGEALSRLHRERYKIYRNSCDEIVPSEFSPEKIADIITERHYG